MIQFKNVTKQFGKVRALDDITLDFPTGKIIGLFGPNGAGKSTTLKLIAGLNRPDNGEIRIDGKPPRDSRANIAYLPEINHLYPWWTLRDAADFIRTFYGDWVTERYQQQLAFLNLDETMKLSKISKGQLAKCKLLLTVSRQAPYLLLDEPFSGIDIMTRDEIINALIHDYSADRQTVIISTHEINEIENLIDYVFFLDRGQIVLAGDTDTLRAERKMSLVEIMKEAFKHANQ